MRRGFTFGATLGTCAALAAVVMSMASRAATVQVRPLWAVGYTANFRRLYPEGPIIERLDGSTWSHVASPQVRGGWLNGVSVVTSTDAWAVGYYFFHTHALIEHWNGSSWTVTPAAKGGGDKLSAVAGNSPHDVWAVGTKGAPVTSTLMEHWDGSSWQQVSSPSPGSRGSSLDAVTVLSANDAWAVGSDSKPLIEHWAGSSWKLVSSPNVGPGQLVGISAVAPRDIWAVGCIACGTQKPRTLIEHWNGVSWKRIPSPNPGDLTGLQGVAAVSATDAWAVGGILDRSGAYYTLIEHWNGSTWRQVPSYTPQPNGLAVSLYAVAAVSPSSVWAVGDYDTGRAFMTLAEHWNGQSWTQVSTVNPALASHLDGVG